MVSTASIHNPENSPRRLVRRLGHHQVNKLVEGGNASIGSHPSENLAPKDIPGCMVGHSSFPLVFEFDSLFISRARWQTRMATSQDLDRFLICRKHVFVRPKPLTFPKPSVQVQNHAGFADKLRVTREKPITVAPRLERILAKKPGQTTVTEVRQFLFLDNHSVQVRDREPAERQLVFPQGLANNGNSLSSFLRTICHRPSTSRQVSQSCYRPFRAAIQKSLTLIQHSLFATTQYLCSGRDGLAIISQQYDQDANHQPGAFASLLLCLTQCLLLLAAEADSIFVRFTSDGTLSPPSLGWSQFTLKTFGRQV